MVDVDKFAEYFSSQTRAAMEDLFPEVENKFGTEDLGEYDDLLARYGVESLNINVDAKPKSRGMSR